MPIWARRLKEFYWRISLEGRDKAKRRRYYRYAAKEKLRLAEQGINQDVIIAVCKYLANLNAMNGYKLNNLLKTLPK